VPLGLLQDIEFLTGSLFGLPVQRKLKSARSETGVSGYGVARIASFFNKQMWSEGFTITGSPLNDFRKLWPQHHLNYWYIFYTLDPIYLYLCLLDLFLH
jgi:gibberellin 3-beta-dioxygenase